jgi:hypothetical protein
MLIDDDKISRARSDHEFNDIGFIHFQNMVEHWGNMVTGVLRINDA